MEAPTDWSGTDWIVASTTATAIFTAIMAAIMWWQYRQTSTLAGSVRPIRITPVRDGAEPYDPAMDCWRTDVPSVHLRCLRRLSGRIYNRSGVPQKLNALECKVLWPRNRFYMNDTVSFTMQPHDGGNFDIRMLDFDLLDIGEEQLEIRRNEARRERTRYLIRLKVETAGGRVATRWLYQRLPLYGDQMVKVQTELTRDPEWKKDVEMAHLIDDAGQLLSDDHDDLADKEIEWANRCQLAVGNHFGPSKRALFRAAMEKGRTSKQRIEAGREYLKGLV